MKALVKFGQDGSRAQVIGTDLDSLGQFLPGLLLVNEPKVAESGDVVRPGQSGPLGLLLPELGEKVNLRTLFECLVSGTNEILENFPGFAVLSEFAERKCLVVELGTAVGYKVSTAAAGSLKFGR